MFDSELPLLRFQMHDEGKVQFQCSRIIYRIGERALKRRETFRKVHFLGEKPTMYLLGLLPF